jgi:uncharacterized integral membrane protein
MAYLMLAFVFALVVAVFAVQNSLPVTVSFLWWGFQTSLVLVILLSAIFGALTVLLLAVPVQVKARWALKRARQKHGELEAEISILKNRFETELEKQQTDKPKS